MDMEKIINVLIKLIEEQGEVRTGQRIVDAILLYIFMKWLSLDTCDYIRQLIAGRRRWG